MTGKVDNARDKMAREIFADWDEDEVKELVRLLRRFADAVTGGKLTCHSVGKKGLPDSRKKLLIGIEPTTIRF
ncbi:hypothetical protein SRABI05_03637 [Agrobacterium fabrum]|nr:hypothetical protein SRABI46_03835 [Agrobacterium fabrum]CAH0275633.1 hypothetical protein SRABI05_03637 [Agrobacterium fabrum]